MEKLSVPISSGAPVTASVPSAVRWPANRRGRVASRYPPSPGNRPLDIAGDPAEQRAIFERMRTARPLDEGDTALSRVAAFLRAHVDAAVTGGAERRG